MQFDQRLAGRIGDGEGALELALARSTRHLQHQVLPGLERYRALGAQPQAADGGREHAGLGEHGVEVLERQVTRIGVFVDLGFDDEVGCGSGAAGEDLAFVALEIHEGEAGSVAMVVLTFEYLHLAGATHAVAAGVRQPDTGAQAGVEHGLALARGHALAEWLDGDLYAHVSVRLSSTSP